MRVAIYPGSFDPLHDGHLDVLKQTHKMFDKVLLVIGINPDKVDGLFHRELRNKMTEMRKQIEPFGNVDITWTDGYISDFIHTLERESSDNQIEAVIRGMRNTKDFEDEKTLKYLYEDSGVIVPVIHIIASRTLTHVSSSAIRAARKFKK